jgi:hypothetical protein
MIFSCRRSDGMHCGAFYPVCTVSARSRRGSRVIDGWLLNTMVSLGQRRNPVRPSAFWQVEKASHSMMSVAVTVRSESNQHVP